MLRTASPDRRARVHFPVDVTAACGLSGAVPLEEETVRVSGGMVFACAVWVGASSGTSDGLCLLIWWLWGARGKPAARRWRRDLHAGVRGWS